MRSSHYTMNQSAATARLEERSATCRSVRLPTPYGTHTLEVGTHISDGPIMNAYLTAERYALVHMETLARHLLLYGETSLYIPVDTPATPTSGEDQILLSILPGSWHLRMTSYKVYAPKRWDGEHSEFPPAPVRVDYQGKLYAPHPRRLASSLPVISASLAPGRSQDVKEVSSLTYTALLLARMHIITFEENYIDFVQAV